METLAVAVRVLLTYLLSTPMNVLSVDTRVCVKLVSTMYDAFYAEKFHVALA